MGTKWSRTRGCCSNQRLIVALLWVASLSTTMNAHLARDLAIDALEEPLELARRMLPMTLTDHLTRDEIVSREQRGRAVAAIVVGPPFGDPRSQGKDWLGAIEGLDLRLLIDAEDDGGI